MIVIHTDYDLVTSILSTFAASFVAASNSAVTVEIGPGSVDSPAARAQAAVSTHAGVAVLFFGHGRATYLESQDQQILLDGASLPVVSGRVVCATCCYSAVTLAGATQYGATVLGYRDTLNVPRSPAYRSLLEECILSGPSALAAGATVTAAEGQMAGQYRAVAARLLGGSITDQVVAVRIFDWNANGLVSVGNGNRTI